MLFFIQASKLLILLSKNGLMSRGQEQHAAASNDIETRSGTVSNLVSVNVSATEATSDEKPTFYVPPDCFTLEKWVRKRAPGYLVVWNMSIKPFL